MRMKRDGETELVLAFKERRSISKTEELKIKQKRIDIKLKKAHPR